MKRLWLLLVVLLGCGSTPERDCEEDCRYANDIGACIDRCRKDAGLVCDPYPGSCLNAEE